MEYNLHNLLNNIENSFKGKLPGQITGLAIDSRKVVKGNLFFALSGENVDGHDFLQQALNNGAIAAVVEKEVESVEIAQIIVENSKKALSVIASKYYGQPTSNMTIVGITGTNGKTTVVTLLDKIFEIAGINRGTIGTLGYSINGKKYNSNLTTPLSLDLQQIFYKMKEQSVTHVAMEVSAHALSLNRVDNVVFHGAAFTNLSQDHLDYYHTMDNYAKSKAELFKKVGENGFLICNLDDEYYRLFRETAKIPVTTFSLEQNADLIFEPGVTYKNKIVGVIHSPAGKININSNLSGKFNLKNILTAIAISLKLKINREIIEKAIKKIEFIPGRLQEVSQIGKGRIYIDYAHTPDAIENVLATLKELKGNNKLIALFGCGGNRDKKKRPKMAEAVEKFADYAILTSDNPRFENPEEIIEDVSGGFTGKIPVEKISDRKTGIQFGLKITKPGDIFVILGKGHESYIEIKGKRYNFNEVQIINEYLGKIYA